MLLGLKGEILTDSQKDNLLKQLTTLNKEAKRIAEKFDIHAATDITGFGLIGHLHEMSLSSKLEATLYVNSIPFYAGAKDLAITGLVPAAAYTNRTHFESYVKNSNSIEEYKMDLLYDPQSSGGLLLALAEDQALELTKLLKEAEISASIIGRFKDRKPENPGNIELLEA
jgi:selenide,water dikinase